MTAKQTLSIHDNNVYAFTVACEQRRLVLHTEFRDAGSEEYTDVIFSGVVAHEFHDVLAGNILFGIDEVDVRQVVQERAELFAERKPFAWPDGIEYRDAEQLMAFLHERGVKGFEVSSSLGLGGFVLATGMELRPRETKVVTP